MLCCQFSLIKDIINTLQSHERLQKLSAEFLLKLIESLGQHSLEAEEMKILIQLLQNRPEDGAPFGDNTTEFPYKSHVIHIISSIAKGDGFETCRNYFDIQVGHYSSLNIKCIQCTVLKNIIMFRKTCCCNLQFIS